MQIAPSTVCLVIIAAMFLRLRLSPQASPDLVFFAGLVAFVVLGDLTPKEALAGFSSSAVFMLIGLLVVTASLYHTGVISDAGTYLAQHAHTRRGVVAFMSLAVAPLSALQCTSMSQTPETDCRTPSTSSTTTAIMTGIGPPGGSERRTRRPLSNPEWSTGHHPPRQTRASEKTVRPTPTNRTRWQPT